MNDLMKSCVARVELGLTCWPERQDNPFYIGDQKSKEHKEMSEREKKDLMLKAAIQFKGKWPEGGDFLYVSNDKHPSKGIFEALTSHVSNEYWDYLCTKQEYLDFVDSLFLGAPDDAEFVGNECFYRNVSHNGYFFYPSSGGGWEINEGTHMSKYLIPRPKHATENWVPEVRQECEFSCTARGNETDWTIGRVDYMSKHTCVIKSPLISGEFVAHPDTMNFRPLKAQGEVDREEFVALGLKAMNNSIELACRNVDVDINLMKVLFDEGCRFND